MPRKTRPDVRLGFACALASMRPRPDAAENVRRRSSCRAGWRRFNEAAARCRGKQVCRFRPRPTLPGFNEAAARCRGKHVGSWLVALGRVLASMRPRPDAAENVVVLAGDGLDLIGFNEAAARCRGKPIEIAAGFDPVPPLQ